MKCDLICIACPFGCDIHVYYEINSISSVSGNRCKKGFEYASQEIFDPRRMVTTTTKLKGSKHSLLPVRTEKAVPKTMIFNVVKAASKALVQIPVKIGDVVVANVCGTGTNLIATREIND